MLLFESLGLYHSISIEQPVRLSLPSPGGVPLNDRRAQVGCGDNKDNPFRYTNTPNYNLSIPFILLLVAGWVLGLLNLNVQKISHPRLQCFLTHQIKSLTVCMLPLSLKGLLLSYFVISLYYLYYFYMDSPTSFSVFDTAISDIQTFLSFLP